jgi:lysozyme
VKTGHNGIALIKHYEQCRLKAFKPIITDPWTIGWGKAHGVNAGDTCTQKQADDWLLDDVSEAEFGVMTAIHTPLTQNQFDALVSFQYNTGALGRSTLKDLLNAGDISGAADQFPRWNKSKGMVLAGLTKRREDERRLFLTQDNAPFNVGEVSV